MAKLYNYTESKKGGDEEPWPLFCASTEKKKGLPYLNWFVEKKAYQCQKTDEFTELTILCKRFVIIFTDTYAGGGAGYMISFTLFTGYSMLQAKYNWFLLSLVISIKITEKF